MLKARMSQLVESKVLSSHWFQIVNLHPYGAVLSLPPISIPASASTASKFHTKFHPSGRDAIDATITQRLNDATFNPAVVCAAFTGAVTENTGGNTWRLTGEARTPREAVLFEHQAELERLVKSQEELIKSQRWGRRRKLTLA